MVINGSLSERELKCYELCISASTTEYIYCKLTWMPRAHG